MLLLEYSYNRKSRVLTRKHYSDKVTLNKLAGRKKDLLSGPSTGFGIIITSTVLHKMKCSLNDHIPSVVIQFQIQNVMIEICVLRITSEYEDLF